ncbi:MAG: class I SAM-dependent methyltransferase [Patescibacteria group bacterium]|nr:class I SAM-dependent methyltransferase [Patescibacteria group bacterium]
MLVCFAGVLLVGAPYLPTLSPQVSAALTLADLQPGQTLLELGCGDGKVVLAAAKAGYTVIGYELNPLMAAVAWLRTRRYGKQVQIRCANFWQPNWPPADAIFVFLLPKYMTKLDNKVMQQYPKGVKVISFAFRIPNREPKNTLNGVFLYKY